MPAFTLVELMLVVGVLAILAMLAVGRYSRLAAAARVAAAEADLRAIRDAFCAPAEGYLHDMGGIPGFSHGYLRVANLFMPTNVYGSCVMDESALAQTRGIRVDDDADDATCRQQGRALPQAFTGWDEMRGRGWRGPYLAAAVRAFPSRDDVRFPGDMTFAARQFFPSLEHLRLPHAFKDATCASVYGFVGEPALFDPWGNPYVLQIPPPQAFSDVTNVTDRIRFQYARIVSAGPDGILQTPCHGANTTNVWWATGWPPRQRRLSRQAGLVDATNRTARGDDLVLFLVRNDIDEGKGENE